MASYDKHYYDGAWQASSGTETIAVISSATEQEFARVPRGTPQDVDRAVKAARRGFESWSRLAVEERAAFSPDALTGMESSLRFGGPETLESKIFARLSAWQNWIFQRPNAVGPKGALKVYGSGERSEFDRRRV